MTVSVEERQIRLRRRANGRQTHWDILLEGKKNPIGYVGYAIIDGEKEVYVHLHPAYRGKGIAAKAEDMLAHQLGIREWFAVIRINNKPSIRAHEKAGWKKTNYVYSKTYRRRKHT